MGNSCESGQNIYCCIKNDENFQVDQIYNKPRGIMLSEDDPYMNVNTNESEHFIMRKDFQIKGSKYTGQMVLGDVGLLVPHGFGTQIWSDNTVYQGKYEMGKKHGNGKLTWPDKKHYIG